MLPIITACLLFVLVQTHCQTMKSRTIQTGESLIGKHCAIDAELLEQLFDQAPDVAFFVKDLEGRYAVVNQSLVRRHGLKSKSEVVGKRPSDICEGEFGRIPSQQDSDVLRTGKPLINHLEMQWHQPHKPVWCFTTKLPKRDANGQITGLIGISRDLLAVVEQSEIPSDFASALQEFERDLSGNMTPSSLAIASHLTPQRLARLTKRLFGLTPTQLITKTRISAASRLLLETDLSVSDVAQQCGFYDHSAFTRAFRQATGLTPSRCRQRS